MTWGRRNGDAMNPTLYPNYTVMQDRLEDGYIDYRDNISLSTSAEIYIAPVGLAFKHIHDSIVASGGNPLSPTSTFYGLCILQMEAIRQHPVLTWQLVCCSQPSPATLQLV